jgi:hypothetical protein
MIDIHMHIGRLYMAPPLTPEYVLDFMDRSGIERAALLPMENPEATYFYVTTDEVLRAAAQHPDRFIPFCNIDPRRWTADLSVDYYPILCEYREKGCLGFGEAIAALPVDDPRAMKIYEGCGRLGMPVILDIDGTHNLDSKGLPGLERMVRELPDTVFIGHGPHFWAEISGDVTEEQFGTYPEGAIAPGGAVPHLLGEYPNMYADTSAMSGHNALTRDPEYGYRFLEEFQDKLVFGTDLCIVGQEVGIVSYINDALIEGGISPTAYDKITRRNAEALLGLETE